MTISKKIIGLTACVAALGGAACLTAPTAQALPTFSVPAAHSHMNWSIFSLFGGGHRDRDDRWRDRDDRWGGGDRGNYGGGDRGNWGRDQGNWGRDQGNWGRDQGNRDRDQGNWGGDQGNWGRGDGD